MNVGCTNCGKPLTGQQRSYCSEDCSKDASRAKRLMETYNITPEEYDRILAYQGGVCAICKRPPKPSKRLAVDHSHKTGYVRGLLCFLDNKRILGARSDETILALAAYVTNPPARDVIGNRCAPGRPPRKRKTSARNTRTRSGRTAGVNNRTDP